MHTNCGIKLFIFDLGNVVLKFDHRIAIKNISGLSGLPENEVYESIFSSGIERLLDCGKINSREFYARISKKFIKPAGYKNFKNAWADIFRVNPGIDRLLRKLKGKYKLCLLSNTNELHFSFIKKQFPIAGIFDKYFLSYKLHICKPDKKIFTKVLVENKVLPEECIYVDDIEEYAREAEKLGFWALRYKNIKSLKISLRKLGINV